MDALSSCSLLGVRSHEACGRKLSKTGFICVQRTQHNPTTSTVLSQDFSCRHPIHSVSDSQPDRGHASCLLLLTLLVLLRKLRGLILKLLDALIRVFVVATVCFHLHKMIALANNPGVALVFKPGCTQTYHALAIARKLILPVALAFLLLL
jgi:hypothetical protein